MFLTDLKSALLASILLSIFIAVPANGQSEPEDANRPPCTSARCKKIKAFLRAHYCGESPFGNGPYDGCDTRGLKKTVRGTKRTVDYICTWNEATSHRKCEQKGQPSSKERRILISEMRRIGLPQGAEEKVQFIVLNSTSGLSLMSAEYEDSSGPELVYCRVIIATNQNRQVYVLRKVPVEKTDADKMDATTWTPVDIADVDGDGKLEIVLEGDADEDHWFEVIRIENGSFKTIFSGLGYYL
jgi:hypothetical protein